MPNRIKLLLIFFCTAFLQGFGQKNQQINQDTVYVYETITVYDTVFVHDTIRIPEMPTLEPHNTIDGIKAESDFDNIKDPILILISGTHAATFSQGSIIPENLKNSTSMKTLSFFGLVFFAFQHMVVAQSDFGVSAGTGSWWASCNQPVGNRSVSSASTAGLFMHVPVGKQLFLHSALNYSFLRSNYSYKANLDTLSNFIVGEGESASNYQQISLPLELAYRIGKVSVMTGLEYCYRFSESWLNRKMSLLNFTGGINYAVTDKLAVNLAYYQGLTNDYRYKGSIADPNSGELIRNYDDYWKSSRIMLTLSCSLWQPAKKSQNNSLENNPAETN